MTNVDLPSPLGHTVEPQTQERRHRRRKKRRFRTIRRIFRRMRRVNVLLALVVVVGILAVLAMVAGILVINARGQVEDSWESLDRVLTVINTTPGNELTLMDFERLQVSIRDLNRSLSNAATQTAFLRPFDRVNADLALILEALDAASELGQAADRMLNGLRPTLVFLTQGEEEETVAVQLSTGERTAELLGLGRGQFIAASAHLEQAQAIIQEFDLAEVSPDLLVTVDELLDQYERLAEYNDILLNSPDLLTTALGLRETKTYLVLAQNSDELRPSGGYISTYGWMSVRNGRITDFDYSPTTTTSPNPPPDEVASEFEVPDWWIQYDQPVYAAWDGSWFADFPSTAAMAAWYYNEGDNPNSPVDGVIAIDIVGFEYLLQGLGEVTVPEYNRTVSASNFRDVVYEIRAERDQDLAHKRFVAALYQQIMNDWQNVDTETSVELRGAVLKALQEKHIMVYFADNQLNQAMNLLGWSGAQASGVNQDYLMVADANLGSKSNRSVLRQITYDVEIQPDGSLRSRASIAYDFSARVAEQDPAVNPAHYNDINYNNLLQVYTPAQSTLMESTNFQRTPEVVQGDEHTTFVVLTRVEYDSSERYQLVYTTPVVVEQFGPYRRYRLELEKQPGVLAEPVNIQLSLPRGADVISSSPEPDNSYDLESRVLEYRLDLLEDQQIEVVFTQGND